jgi:hypothetical protein
LLNVEPPAGCDPLPKWLLGKGIFKPEIFNNRLRVDKDPTIHLPKYLQCAVSQHRAPAPRGAPNATALSHGMATDAEVRDMFKDMSSRIAKLPVNIQPKANGEMKRFLLEAEKRLQRFELDTEVARTFQGRAQPSTISYKHPKGGVKKPPAKRLSDSGKSSVGQRHSNKSSEIAMTTLAPAATTAAARKPPGTSANIPLDQQWHCEYCNRSVKNTSQSVNQHCHESSTHRDNVAKWPPGKPLAPFTCSLCAEQMVNDAKLIREHQKKCTPAGASAGADAQATPKQWHCATCNLDMSAAAEVVNAHNKSKEHDRIRRWDAEPNVRDGARLAAAARAENGRKAETAAANSKNAAAACCVLLIHACRCCCGPKNWKEIEQQHDHSCATRCYQRKAIETQIISK